MADPPQHADTPLRIAIDVGPLHGHRTGVGVATAHLLDELTARSGISPLPYLVSFRARPGSGQRRLPLPAAAAMRMWARTDRPRIDRWIRDADVVHGTNYVAPPSRRPTVISVYDCWFLANPGSAAPAVQRAGEVLRRAVRRGARIHVSSAATARVAADLLATDRISVVHLGPPAPSPTITTGVGAAALPGALSDRPLLAAIGTVERRKDIPALVDAFARIAPGRPDLQLAIAGAPGDDQERLLERIAACPAGVSERIHVLGPVTSSVRDTLLQRAEALVYPSVDEGFGFPILEAQRAGTAVVARPSGSIPEVGGSGVELAADQTIEALTDAITRVLDDEGRRQQLIEAGAANLTRFSWSRTADGLVEAYRSAITEQS